MNINPRPLYPKPKPPPYPPSKSTLAVQVVINRKDNMTYKKLQDFWYNFDTAITNIKSYLEPDKYAPHMHELALWLLETEHNPYAYLDHNYAMYMSDAIGFDMILSMLHHALYDDGDVTFVTVNNKPRIVFCDRWDDNFRLRCLTDSEKEIEAKGYPYISSLTEAVQEVVSETYPYKVQVLDIKPNEFGALYDAYEKEQELKYAWVDELIESNNKKG